MTESKPEAIIEMENGALIKLELDPDSAPNTVKNFITLSGKGFYSGLIFHRVIPGVMIQGGCPEGNGTGGPGYTIRGEFTANGHHNNLKHERGVISMARAQNYDSGGSQFFITVSNAPHLDGQYAAFGRVTDGINEVDRIVAEPTDSGDRPLTEQKIRQIRVENFGVSWDPSKKI